MCASGSQATRPAPARTPCHLQRQLQCSPKDPVETWENPEPHLSFSVLCRARACATSWPSTAASRSSSRSSSLIRPARTRRTHLRRSRSRSRKFCLLRQEQAGRRRGPWACEQEHLSQRRRAAPRAQLRTRRQQVPTTTKWGSERLSGVRGRTGEHDDLAAGQHEGVGRLVLHHHDLPVEPAAAGHLSADK